MGNVKRKITITIIITGDAQMGNVKRKITNWKLQLLWTYPGTLPQSSGLGVESKYSLYRQVDGPVSGPMIIPDSEPDNLGLILPPSPEERR